MQLQKTHEERAIKIDFQGDYDVVVCGAGPSGTTASLAAARAGLSVLLVEALGQIGGMGTSGLVSHWLSGRTPDAKHWVIGGLFRELSYEAEEFGAAIMPDVAPGDELTPHGWTHGGKLPAGVPFDPDKMAAFLDKKMADAGVDELFFTRVVDVDTTGDGDVAFLSGCDYILGREEDNLMTPVTLEMHVTGVDTSALDGYIETHPAYRHLDPDVTLPEESWEISSSR